ncbi:cation diffusion facilitator family transporter [Glycomyces halotolerans]
MATGDHPRHDHHGHERPHHHQGEHHSDHAHDHAHDHRSGGFKGLLHSLRHAATPHSHDSADKIDSALESSRQGLRALWLSLAMLGVTAIGQLIVYAFTGSVALLGDTLHNIADALTAVPLGIAFLLGRRAANRRYTYGYGRAEDVAGVIIVAVIAASAVAAGLAAIDRLGHPAGVDHLWAVAAAGLIGCIGNEIVAQYRIRVGRRIGSAALVADGLHARTDGLTSLAVLLSAGGVALGWGWADPIVGLAITAMILVVLKSAAVEIYRRLMDAVDPQLVDRAETTLTQTPGVRSVGALRMRWIGHRLQAEVDLAVDAGLSVLEAHAIAIDAEHRLVHTVPRLMAATVHTDPAEHHQAHQLLTYHRLGGRYHSSGRW